MAVAMFRSLSPGLVVGNGFLVVMVMLSRWKQVLGCNVEMVL